MLRKEGKEMNCEEMKYLVTDTDEIESFLPPEEIDEIKRWYNDRYVNGREWLLFGCLF